jgi:hypothetical protein
MTSNQWINTSRRVYSRLLCLYPREHQADYGPSMRQVFTDQCRAAFQFGGLKGMILLWLRTLKDLFVSVLREHVTSPRSGWGLLEAVPGRPLPWKGVILVLLPCLVFFIGQIGQLAGQDWFFLLVRRAAFYLIVPVLLVWVFTRKFPVWGLIPFGIFYRTAMDLLYSLGYHLEKLSGTIFHSLVFFQKTYYTEVNVGIVLVLIAVIVFLAAVIYRQPGFSRTARIWGGIFLLLLIPELLTGLYYYQDNQMYLYHSAMESLNLQIALREIINSSYYSFSSAIEYLLLILVGALLARRHGRLAVLLPLGYLIPAVVVGRYDNTTATSSFLLWASISVFTFRTLVTLVAPVWIVRSASDGGQRRAGVFGLLVAVGIVLVAHVGMLLDYLLNFEGAIGYDLPGLYYTFSPDIILFVGFALAISLYRRAPADSMEVREGAAAATTA